jgi:hypothetical protein
MEDNIYIYMDSSMLCEHTLLPSGDVADCGSVYSGWPARSLPGHWKEMDPHDNGYLRLICPMCRKFPEHMSVTLCGHVFCQK